MSGIMPISSAAALAWSTVCTVRDLAQSRPILSMACLKKFAVFAFGDRVGFGPDHLHAVFLGECRLCGSSIERLSAVCPPKVGKSASGLFRGDDLLQDIDLGEAASI